MHADFECPKCGHVYIDEMVRTPYPLCPYDGTQMVMRIYGKVKA